MHQDVKEHVAVTIAPDGMSATLQIFLPEGEPSGLMMRDVEASLAAAGVTTGVDYALAEKLLKEGKPGDRVAVARGTPPTTGKNGFVEFTVNPLLVEPGETSRMNLRDRGFIHNVVAGQLLAVIHSPGAGTPGVDVKGRVAPAIAGTAAVLRAGPNTAFSIERPRELVATADGNFVPGTDSATVETTVCVKGNIDLAVGNIDFVGSLIVEGDILGDFVVKVKKSLEVKGNVEDARLEVGENATIHKGFFGHGKGRLIAGGVVRAHHILNQTIHADGDVHIEKEAVNATVRSNGSINAPRAVIAGGTMDALHDVDVGTLGSVDGGQARVRAGKRTRLLERAGQIDKELKHGEKQLGEVKAAVYKLVKLKVDGVKLTADQEVLLAKLQEAQKTIPLRAEQLQAERVQVGAELQKSSDGCVIVHETVFENVLIEINGAKKVIDSAIQGVVFTERIGAIEVRSREDYDGKSRRRAS